MRSNHSAWSLPFLSLFCALVLALPALPASAQIGANLYNGMQWRLIGPFRGGRVDRVIGIPSQPNVFYMDAENGGMWKTTDAGQTWVSLFKGDENNSVGSFAIAPSNPNIIYVGSGEATQRPDLSIGTGIYKSTDAGKTWQHLGLRDGEQIAAIAVDPHNPNRLFVAVLGHPFGANAERGIYRSTNGGQTFQKVFYINDNVGAGDVALDPANPNSVYAVLWATRSGPAVIGGGPLARVPGSGLYKSTDGGNTWRQIGQGLPTDAQGLGRIRLAIAPSDPNRVYVSVRAGFGSNSHSGFYRSDDGGQTFTFVSDDPRNAGGFITVAPNDPDEIYASSTALYRSMNAGKTFTAVRGAPGGNDYHHVWINPLHPDHIAVGVDQGATISVNGGTTWSSWYNQPTAQMYSVATDNQFPFRVYGNQQDSGSFGIASRSNEGEITFREWYPVGGEEDGNIAPDPLHPNIVYSSRGDRFNWTTGETTFVGPQLARLMGKYRFSPYGPIQFSPVDPHLLYLAGNVLFKTTNGGHIWQIISPDLSRADPGVPGNLGPFGADLKWNRHLGVIYSLGPSFKNVNTIWAGTNDGLIWVTHDGGVHWNNVTPPALKPWDIVTKIVASHFDNETAYASVSRFRLNDLKPYIYATHNGGKTWKLIVNGLSDDAPVNVVREDPVQKGLLYAGTERAVWFSADDGNEWHSLQLNLPVTSMRDLAIRDNDLVVATHGRSDWILDDVTPLRQLAAAETANPAFLYAPEVAYQIPRNDYPDTQLPPEFPAGQNPPNGAIIDYYLKNAANGPVSLEIYDASGKLVRRYSSTDKPAQVDFKEWNYPTYWLRKPQALSGAAGMHRFVWSLHYPSPQVSNPTLPMGVIYHGTPIGPPGPAALPGKYTVKLTVDGHAYTQLLTVRMDPRNDTPMSGLTQQFTLTTQLCQDINRTYAALQQAKTENKKAPPALVELNATLLSQYNSIYGGLYGGGDGNPSVMSAPTTQQVEAVRELNHQVNAILSR